MNMQYRRWLWLKTTFHVLLTFLILLYLLTGYGIANYRIVEPLTFHLLNKPRSFILHEFLAIPFIIVLAGHIYFSLAKPYRKD